MTNLFNLEVILGNRYLTKSSTLLKKLPRFLIAICHSHYRDYNLKCRCHLTQIKEFDQIILNPDKWRRNFLNCSLFDLLWPYSLQLAFIFFIFCRQNPSLGVANFYFFFLGIFSVRGFWQPRSTNLTLVFKNFKTLGPLGLKIFRKFFSRNPEKIYF